MDFEAWLRAQLRPAGASVPAGWRSRLLHRRPRHRGRFLQGLTAGAALTFLFLGASSSGSMPVFRVQVLPVEPDSVPVTVLAGAPTVPEPAAPAPAASTAAAVAVTRVHPAPTARATRAPSTPEHHMLEPEHAAPFSGSSRHPGPSPSASPDVDSSPSHDPGHP